MTKFINTKLDSDLESKLESDTELRQSQNLFLILNSWNFTLRQKLRSYFADFKQDKKSQ